MSDIDKLTINLSCIIDDEFKTELRNLIREIIQEELDKKNYDGVDHLRKVIESGEINNGEGI